MTPFEVEQALRNLTVIVDTREQDTRVFRNRLEQVGFPFIRQKLDFGDYSCRTELSDGSSVDFSDRFAIERKMSIDELAMCYTSNRKRFTAEFERAKNAQAKMYLLIENATFEKIIGGQYRSRVAPNALIGSIFAFLARYNCQIIFCKTESTGRVIREILYREAKEILNNS